MHQKQLVNHGRAVAGGHEQASKRRDARIYYIVDMWTATGTRVQPTQGKVRKISPRIGGTADQNSMNG